MADIQCLSSDKGINSLTVRITNLDTSWTDGRRTVYWYTVVAANFASFYDVPDSNWVYRGQSYLYVDPNNDTQGEHLIESLESGTKYYIKAHISADNTGQTWDFYGEATTLSSSGGDGLDTSAPTLILYKESGFDDANQSSFGYILGDHSYTVSFYIQHNQTTDFTRYQYRYKKKESGIWDGSALDVLNEYFGITGLDICSKYEVQVRLYSPNYKVYTDWSNICQFETQGITGRMGMSLTTGAIRTFRFEESRINTLAEDSDYTFNLLINKQFNGKTYEKIILDPVDIKNNYSVVSGYYVCDQILPDQGTGHYSLSYIMITKYNGVEYRGINYSTGDYDDWTVFAEWDSLGLVTNIICQRVNKGFMISWDAVSNANTYTLSIYKDGKSNQRVLNVTGLTNTSYITTSNTDLICSQLYGISITPIKSGYRQPPTSIIDTTAPSIPIISCSNSSGGEVTIDWTLEQVNSSINTIWITLYRSDGITPVQRKSSNSTSGSVTFTGVTDGSYVVKSITEYKDTNENDIQCVDENGENYVARLSIIMQEGNSSFEWEQIYEYSDGGAGTICEKAYMPMDENGIHPMTYTEWNRFVDRVNEARQWASDSGLTVRGDNLVTVVQGDDFVAAYKAAVASIQGIVGYGTYLPTSYPVTLNAQLFFNLRDEVEAVFKYFD